MMRACQLGHYGAEEHLSVPLDLRQRRLQTKIQKEGRCEEDQPSRAHRKLRVHRKRINKRYAARERCASIPTSTPSISRRASRTRSAPCRSLLSISFVTVMPQAPMPPHSLSSTTPRIHNRLQSTLFIRNRIPPPTFRRVPLHREPSRALRF